MLAQALELQQREVALSLRAIRSEAGELASVSTGCLRPEQRLVQLRRKFVTRECEIVNRCTRRLVRPPRAALRQRRRQNRDERLGELMMILWRWLLLLIFFVLLLLL